MNPITDPQPTNWWSFYIISHHPSFGDDVWHWVYHIIHMWIPSVYKEQGGGP